MFDTLVDIGREAGRTAYDLRYPDGIPKPRIDPQCRADYNNAQHPPRKDPLTLDLDGDVIETIVASSSILFDHDGDGIKTGTGWISADDGFLVLDRNGNGGIDNGAELFGDSTPLSAGGNATDGFAALKQEDSNDDGKVDSTDANWTQLRVWRDMNQDRISQASELLTLDALGITSFNTAKTDNNQTLANGNQIADLGSYTKADGSVGTMGEVGNMADVNLADETFYREFPDQIPLAEGVAELPEMQGSGKVRDLHEAASQSTELKDLLTQFSQATTRQAQRALVDQMLDAWANTSGLVETLQERANQYTQRDQYSSGGYAISYQQFGDEKIGDYVIGSGTQMQIMPEWNAIVAGWEAKLHILEAFNGRYFFNLFDDSNTTGSGGVGASVDSGSGGGGIAGAT